MTYQFQPIRWTPTQTRILATLSDGLPHHRNELRECLNDSQAGPNALNVALYDIRKLLRPMGQDIICELKQRTIWYRHVRLLHSPNDGYR